MGAMPPDSQSSSQQDTTKVNGPLPLREDCRKKEKAKMQMYPLQMMDNIDQSFDKIAIDLVTNINVSTLGNQHILTIIDHLTALPESFPTPKKKVSTIFCTFINSYLHV